MHVVVVSGKSFKIHVSTRIRKFYACANAIFCNSKCVRKLHKPVECVKYVQSGIFNQQFYTKVQF